MKDKLKRFVMERDRDNEPCIFAEYEVDGEIRKAWVTGTVSAISMLEMCQLMNMGLRDLELRAQTAVDSIGAFFGSGDFVGGAVTWEHSVPFGTGSAETLLPPER